MRSVICGILFAILLTGYSELQADDNFRLNAEIGSQKISGFTQYSLQFPIYQEGYYEVNGNSRLKYPLSNYLSGGHFSLTYKGWNANFGYWGSFRYSSSKSMQDWDWISSNMGEQIDLAYGTADPHPRMHYYQMGIRYDFKTKLVKFGPFIKYSKYHSEFNVSDLTQFWYVDLENGNELNPPHDTMIAGRVLYYEQDLKIPIFGVNFGVETRSGQFEFFTALGISPFVAVDDYDDHLLREDSLEAWNSGSGGNGFLFEFGSRANLVGNFWLDARFYFEDYKIDTKGTQRTYDFEIESHIRVIGIDTEVKGVMRKFQLTASYFWGI
jgi:hypothetical protein